ncbi:hypothetical protein BH09MYX1_BH09MYX1_41400 [soil metagenome]
MNRLLLAFVSVGALAAVVVSCTGQSEGQRCQVQNNDDDCQSGLICTAAAQITIPGTGKASNADICCPLDRSQATEDICKVSAISPGSDAGLTDSSTVLDTGTPDAASDGQATDAGSDGATDGGSDASSDAPNDSADAGG